MERIIKLSNHLTGKPPKITPDMQKELDRIQIQPKKIQTLEDQRRLIQEFKSKADIDGHEFGRFVLGNLYEMRRNVGNFIKNDPDFNSFRAWQTTSRDDIRWEVNLLLSKLLKHYNFTTQNYDDQFWHQTGVFETMAFGFGAVATKIAVHCFLYAKSILALGTEKHIKYAQRAFEMKDFGCFGLTELAHGSNVQGCITTATYDPQNEVFIINTPNEKGAKFWIGNAAQTANMSLCLANMIVDGVDYGIHIFIVPIRKDSHHLMPGVIISDCGDKMGLSGIDNGMISFRNVKIPRENLLDKVTQVAPDGTVTSLFSKKSKRFAVQLAALSDGRVKIGMGCLSQSLVSLMIAGRYLSVRRQFGSRKYDEQVLLDYPAVQKRIIPYYSRGIVSYFAALDIAEMWNKNSKEVLNPKNMAVQEMHALISIIKPISSWHMMEASRECRELCGGLGYSSYSRLPDIHIENHVNMTWEGDNSVLLQQTGRFLLKNLMRIAQGEINSFESAKYLTIEDLSGFKFEGQELKDFTNLDKLQGALTYIAQRSAQESATEVQIRMGQTDAYEAWNESLPFNLENAALIYGYLFIFTTARRYISNCPVSKNKEFLSKLLIIYSLDVLRKFSTYTLDYFTPEHIEMMEEVNLTLFDEVKHNMVKSFDFLLMNETLTQSTIGAEDGNCYDRLISEIFADRKNFGRPEYWRYLWDVRNGRDEKMQTNGV